MTDTYAVFASPDFDAKEYANAILAGEPFPVQTSVKPTRVDLEPAKEDISVAISKLNLGIEDVSKQIKNVVTTHHEALLAQAAGANDLQSRLGTVRGGLDEVTTSLDKVRLKIRTPYQVLEKHVSGLEKLQQASDVLRRSGRFVIVARRLELQMKEMQEADGQQYRLQYTVDKGKYASKSNIDTSKPRLPSRDSSSEDVQFHEGDKERAIAKAALSIAELGSLLGDTPDSSTSYPQSERDTSPVNVISLRSVSAIATHIPAIEAARIKVTTEMETMVLTGLSTLNQSLLASSLQTAYNLGALPTLVRSLVSDLGDTVEERIRTAFDLVLISKDAGVKDSTPASHGLLYKSRLRTEPTSVTAPQWSAALWNRLDGLIEDMVGCCIKVYALEKILKLKKDTVTQANFFDEAMKLLDNKPSVTFWTVLARSLEKYCRDAAKTSTFLQQTLSTGYPRLVRLFQDLFAQVAVHTDTIYTQERQSPETILVLRALSNFEALYLSRSLNRLNEAVGQAFAGGVRVPPSTGEGIAIARTVINELDSAKFDPLLVSGVAKNVQSSLEMLLTRVDAFIMRDRPAYSLVGPASTPQQMQNAQMVNFLYHCCSKLEQLHNEYPESILSNINPSIEDMRKTYERIVDPLLGAVRRELNAIIARLHRIDLGKSSDTPGLGGSSTYMRDLVDKLTFIKNELFSDFNVGVVSRGWVMGIVKDLLRTFVLHASIAKPLSENGKLQLTSDMTELEFALSAFVAEGQSKRGANLDIFGDDYKALRAMRPLLFLENGMLSSSENTSGLPPLIVSHHILVRSPIPLPHTLHGWQEAEYVRWVMEHTETEALTLIETALSHWEKVHETPGPELETSKEYVRLARAVLSNAKNVSA